MPGFFFDPRPPSQPEPDKQPESGYAPDAEELAMHAALAKRFREECETGDGCFSDEECDLLASADVDVFAAVALVVIRGCPHRLALRILL